MNLALVMTCRLHTQPPFLPVRQGNGLGFRETPSWVGHLWVPVPALPGRCPAAVSR